MDAQWFNSTQKKGKNNAFYIDPLWNSLVIDYEFLAPLGAGSFGQVMKAKHLKSGKIVAVKLMKNLFDSQYSSKKLLSEIQILRKLTAAEDNVFST
mgnify:CR=1 FL=1